MTAIASSMSPVKAPAAQPVGGGLFDSQPSYYQQPGYYYQQPTYGGSNPVSDAIDSFTRSFQNTTNDFQRSMRRMERTMRGEPEYSIPRLASWGGGAMLAVQVADSMMRNRPEGLVMLAILGVGAFAGNQIYDWFMDNWGYKWL